MATEKQHRALNIMVENGGNISQAMMSAGYSPNTAKTPQKLTDSSGFIELCENIGLTDSLLLEALVEDIKEKKGNRKAELELGFKIKGRLILKEAPSEKMVTGLKIIHNHAFDNSLSDNEKEKILSLLKSD